MKRDVVAAFDQRRVIRDLLCAAPTQELPISFGPTSSAVVLASFGSVLAAERQDPDTPTAVAVRAAVAGLPRRERAVVVLRFFADFSVRDVADLLGMPEGTVKTLTARALAGMRAAGLIDLREASDAQHP